ncbi:nicotianamine synthase family protein [uncultured Methanobacterium sp.]|uniref:nicotianamine synthase family protein n=1 Tax=uncultured Methanobacterium sp. TaxID=176306 RepID=UPI002AA66096|nr:nicotianamine synthase family protein [uncultured Methanobacterium sp.]
MSCYKYWDKIKEIANSLKGYGDYTVDEMPLDEIIPLLDSVEEIAHDQEIDFDSAKHILDDEKMNEALQLIRKFYVGLGARLETDNAKSILKSDDPWKTLKSFHFYQRYQGLLRNENQLVKFTPEQKVVFIGGGPLPLTLILLNKIFKARCVSVEVLPEVAELSRKVIEKLGLESEIEVVLGDETSLGNIDYTVVMVAALAEPKERVFANVWEVVDTVTPVLYRTYTGMRAILYSPVTEKATRGFHKEVMILPTGKVNNTSVLIRKVV